MLAILHHHLFCHICKKRVLGGKADASEWEEAFAASAPMSVRPTNSEYECALSEQSISLMSIKPGTQVKGAAWRALYAD